MGTVKYMSPEQARGRRDERYQTTKDLLIDLKSLKQNLEFEAKLERSAPRALGSGTTARTVKGQAILAAAPAQATQYVSGIREQKRNVVLAVVLSVAVLAALAYLGNAYLRRGGTITSIAVLPLSNANNDPNTEYLSDGVTESIINSLSQLPELKVIARTTVFRYKGQSADPQKIGRELGVGAVLTGKVLQRGDTLIIQAELVKVADGSEL